MFDSKNAEIRPVQENDMLDFDSEPEIDAVTSPNLYCNRNNICFVKIKKLKRKDKRILAHSDNVLKLPSCIRQRNAETRESKTFKCKYCNMKFSNRTSLGGHTGKKHTYQSDNYRLRQELSKYNKIEKQRSEYIKRSIG